MGTAIRMKLTALRARWKAWMARRSRVGRLTIRLLLIMTVAQGLRSADFARGLDLFVEIVGSVILAPLLLILLYRWIMHRVLWKVRNRLIVTYLLMGLAPIVLFGTLGGVAAYVLAGQFATNTALSTLDQASLKVRDESVGEAAFSAVEPPRPGSSTKPLPPPAPRTGGHLSLQLSDGTSWHPLSTPDNAPTANGDAGEALSTPAPPSLVPPFRGLVLYNGQLYLCAETPVPIGNRPEMVLGSEPLGQKKLNEMAKGLGTIMIVPGFTHLGDDPRDVDVGIRKEDKDDKDAPPRKATVVVGGKAKQAVGPDPQQKFSVLEGGKLADRTHFFDQTVVFSAPLNVTSWTTGRSFNAIVVVKSRPSFLYTKLFENSFTSGKLERTILIAIAIVFAGIEFLALLMAMGISRKITRAVADLYRGTREIDAGNFDHRVRVARHDQLGDLASSFNGMAASVSGLLVQQREQQRLLNELAIAQEVQTTLFPHSPAVLGGLEIHAVCLPARTVGGDYFDFIFGSHSGLCLALGDISGKGISAALLMASLHSAVRAFSLGQDEGEGLSLSPALLLKLLNRHLYLSTQSARYATLFLAFYDPKSRALTYSNGGHLPPVVLSLNGSARRLDVGGSVVGLLEDLEYQEATVHLEPGDLLVAFTDGLTEPENATGQEFGEPQLLGLIQHYRDQPLPLLAGNAFGAVKQWIGSQEQPDDMTVLLARQL